MADNAPEITVLQLPRFKAEARDLIGTDGIEAVAVYLANHPDAGDVMQGAAGHGSCDGRRRARASAYLYVVIAARIYLLRCYGKNFKTDLTPDEKKELRQIAGYLKGAH
jgi:hypothetical protein